MVLGIYGSGGAGKEIREIAEQLGRWEKIVFIDDISECGKFKNIDRINFEAFKQEYSIKQSEIIIGLGEPSYKKMLYDKVIACGYHLINIIHPSAIISPTSHLGKGIVIKAGAVISSDAIIEDNVSIEENAVIAHDAIVHRHSQISALVMVAGYCEIGERTFIAINVPIRDRVKIGGNTIVGIGSAVIRDIPDNVIVYGNPARIISERSEKDLVFKKRN